MKITCAQCQKTFELTQGEIEFYKSKGLSLPKRCKSCREKNKNLSGAADNKAADRWKKRPLWAGVLALLLIVAAAVLFSDIGGKDELPIAPATSASSQAGESGIAVTSEGSVQGISPESSGQGISSESSGQGISPESSGQGISPENSGQNAALEDGYTQTPAQTAAEYGFRTKQQLDSHWEKHGGEFNYADKDEYLAGANRVINDPDALTKTEKEDGDFVFYLEESNEFVILSTDGYIRTYFRPDAGLDYYNRQ